MVGHYNRKKRERGALLVEFAVILPLLGFMLAVALDLSNALRHKQLITDAARQAARIASARGYEDTTLYLGASLSQPCSVYVQLPAMPYADAIAKRTACQYLQDNAKVGPDSWNVAVQPGPIDGIQFDNSDPNRRLMSITVQITTAAPRCILCVGPTHMIRPEATSTFYYPRV